MILHSAEVRWFYPSDTFKKGSPPSPPNEVQQWFQQESALLWPPKERTDRYLLLPGCETTSVKAREGRFEVKAIRGASETVSYGKGVSGRSDAWIKWSYGEQRVEVFIEALEQEPEGWLDVTKWRWMRKFSLDYSNLVEVSVRDQPLQGGNIELTAIQASDNHWWTIGLEAFGPAETVRENLHSVANHFFTKSKPPIALHTTNSCPYPVWLNSLAE